MQYTLRYDTPTISSGWMDSREHNPTFNASVLWEATLALPYGWWNYQHPAMMGVFIGAWSGLPLEAVLVWLAVTYGTVIMFEVVKIWQSRKEVLS